jgi:hypothetical protein
MGDTGACAMNRGDSRLRRRRLAVVVFCVVIGLCLIGAQLAINHVTAIGKPRALWRASLPGLDIGVDTWPAAPGLGGYIEVWYESHDAEDYQPILRLPGAPPVPILPTPRLGEVWT